MPDGCYVARFAPSPSGPLHAGSIAAALASWLDARAHSGRWCLRFEDVDSQRCSDHYRAQIRAQLRALGLEWDLELPTQSTRATRYAHQLQDWLAQGQAYACCCTRRDLEPYRQDGETRYPGTCRARALKPDGLALRFRLPAQTAVTFTDRWHGQQTQDVARQCGDPVLRRRNGDFTYQWAVSLDDAEQGITDVVRGDDLLASTGRQLLLLQALGAAAPRYLHHPLVLRPDGRKLSKSTGAEAISTQAADQTLLAAALALGLALDDPQARGPALLDEALRAWRLSPAMGSGKLSF